MTQKTAKKNQLHKVFDFHPFSKALNVTIIVGFDNILVDAVASCYILNGLMQKSIWIGDYWYLYSLGFGLGEIVSFCEV